LEIVKELPVEAAAMLAPDKDAREYWVVVVKATFRMPEGGAAPVLAEEQVPLIYADEYLGEPGMSSMTAAYDFAPEKPLAEILLTGSAVAPGGRPVTELTVGLQVEGLISKTIRVVGDRTWVDGMVHDLGAGGAAPFTRMPLVYERAFGGRIETEQSQHAHRENLVGTGLTRGVPRSHVFGAPLPNLEHPSQPVRVPGDVTQTVCFGPVAPAWLPRAQFAGTYDKAWLDDRFPLLPTDFDPRFFQTAPADQQVRELRGGERVTLINLTEEGRYQFELPELEMPVVLFFSDRQDEPYQARLDTVHIDTDKRRMCMTWRLKVRRTGKPYALRSLAVGPMSARFWRRHNSPKPYYSSLAELIAAQRAR
jgi:hypothetical protein